MLSMRHPLCVHTLQYLHNVTLQFQQEQGAPALDAEAEEIEAERNAVVIENEGEVTAYHMASREIAKLSAEVTAFK